METARSARRTRAKVWFEYLEIQQVVKLLNFFILVQMDSLSQVHAGMDRWGLAFLAFSRLKGLVGLSTGSLKKDRMVWIRQGNGRQGTAYGPQRLRANGVAVFRESRRV